MSNFRRLYFEPLKGTYHALFLGDNINNDIIYDEFTSSPVTINHGRNTTRILVSVFEDDRYEIIPDRVVIVDQDTVEVYFSEAFSGKIQITSF